MLLLPFTVMVKVCTCPVSGAAAAFSVMPAGCSTSAAMQAPTWAASPKVPIRKHRARNRNNFADAGLLKTENHFQSIVIGIIPVLFA